MARHAAPVLEGEEPELIQQDPTLILGPDTPLAVRVLCYIAVYMFAALGFWCMYLYCFV